MDGQFRTRDLYLAAFLKVAAVPMLPNEQEQGATVFVFEDEGNGVLRTLKDQYFSNYARIQALSYARAIKDLKATLFHRGPDDHA